MEMFAALTNVLKRMLTDSDLHRAGTRGPSHLSQFHPRIICGSVSAAFSPYWSHNRKAHSRTRHQYSSKNSREFYAIPQNPVGDFKTSIYSHVGVHLAPFREVASRSHLRSRVHIMFAAAFEPAPRASPWSLHSEARHLPGIVRELPGCQRARNGGLRRLTTRQKQAFLLPLFWSVDRFAGWSQGWKIRLAQRDWRCSRTA